MGLRAHPKVFVSYRRLDSQYPTDRICERLRRAIPRAEIFRDVDCIPAGVDFRRRLEEAVGGCDVMLVVIGRCWLSTLDDRDDFVRIEVEAALRRDIPVIPVLVSGAAMPAAADLPSGMRELSWRNGRKLRPDPDFEHDMERLACDVRAVRAAGPARALSSAGAIAALAVALLGAGALALSDRAGAPTEEPAAREAATSLALYWQACDAKDGVACKMLGDRYADGIGVERDRGEAIRLYAKSCELGNGLGCSSLGVTLKRLRGRHVALR